MPSLTDLTLENNPIEKIARFQAVIKETFPTVLYLNLQKLLLPSAAKQTPALENQVSGSKVANNM